MFRVSNSVYLRDKRLNDEYPNNNDLLNDINNSSIQKINTKKKSRIEHF